ncbi:MAG: hypothetical protein HY016_08290 [Nitrosomonadales bacterium]|nr:hypothetical protein [Nitrosomonadales bacterium]
MGNVTKLPDKPVREWLVIEKVLRADLTELKADQDMINHVCAVLRPIFMEYAAADFVMETPVEPDVLMKALNAWVHALTSGLFTQIALREIELYQLRGSK